MKVKIKPSCPCGNIQPPPSKSIAHRLILCAALANGTSEIKSISPSEDISATVDCIHALGAKTVFESGALTVTGIDTERLQVSEPLFCRECGSTMRFFIPLCMLTNETTLLYGSKTLLTRPMQIYEEICESQGILYKKTDDHIEVGGALKPAVFTVPGNISSQFISGLLFALPLLPSDSDIVIAGKVESRPYIDLTVAAQSQYGVRTQWRDSHTLHIPGGQKYTPADTVNEGDWSNAAFLYALKYCGYPVNVTDMSFNSLQGDKVCVSYFEALRDGNPVLDVSNCPDLAPILFAFAAMHKGGTFTGTERLRMKESDRGAAMARELSKFGAQLVIGENEIRIPKTELHAPDIVLDGHNDHRIVMSMAVLCVKYGGVIAGAEAVNKSYPGFFEDLEKLKVSITYEAE